MTNHEFSHLIGNDECRTFKAGDNTACKSRGWCGRTTLKGRIYKTTIRKMEGRIYISVVIGNACSHREVMFS